MLDIKENIKKYSLNEAIYLSYCFVRTKLIASNARLIRFPFKMRGHKHIKLGDHFTTGVGCRIDAFPAIGNEGICLTIGKDVSINDYVHIASVSSVTIGNQVLMGSKIYISDHDHGFYGQDGKHDSPMTLPNKRKISYNPVVIKDNVWIGQSVSVLKGVTIGFGSIIGANSVVTKDIPPHCIAVGSPAQVIRTYDFESKLWKKI
ncbi:MAG: lipopolysaccharide O-acetyltransferase [Polaribacter sp.]|jgi:acetyltransferase-like isoleucine patch superfamily enzyme